MKKMSLVLSVLLAATLSVSAQQVKISMVYAGGDPLTKQLISEAVAAFKKANPSVSIVEFPSVGGGSYLDFIKVKDAVGEFPDLIEMRDTALFYRAGKLAPLPAEVTQLVSGPVRFGGQVYTLSYSAQAPLGMIYNADLFQKNGWTEPKTYAEFLSLLEKIKAKKISPIVVGGKDLWHMGFLYSKFWQDEVSAKNPNFIADRYAGKVRFTDASVKKAFTLWSDLFKKGYVDNGFVSTADNQTASILVAGKAAMLYSGTWMLQQIKDADPSFNIGWFPIPPTSGSALHLIGGATAQGWAMSVEAAKDPAKSKAILDFLKFFFQKDNYTGFITQFNGIPSITEKVTYKTSIPAMEDILDVYADTPGKQLMWNQNVGENELPPGFRDFTYKTGMEILVGMKTIDEGLKSIDTQWETATKDFNPVLKK